MIRRYKCENVLVNWWTSLYVSCWALLLEIPVVSICKFVLLARLFSLQRNPLISSLERDGNKDSSQYLEMLAGGFPVEYADFD